MHLGLYHVVIQLANRFNAYPRGVLEDVLVQVNEIGVSDGLLYARYKGRGFTHANSLAVRMALYKDSKDKN